MAGRSEDVARTDGVAGGGADAPMVGVSAANAETVLALLDDDGTVTAWARGAERPAPQAEIGRRAEFFLGPDEGLPVSTIAERRGSLNGWSIEVPAVEHGDATHRVLRVSR